MPDARDIAVDVMVEHWRDTDPQWDPSWPTVARHTLDALASSPEVREALAESVCCCSKEFVNEVRWHDASCGRRVVDAVLAALAGTSGTEAG